MSPLEGVEEAGLSMLELSYDSRKADYKTRGPFGYFGFWGEAATILARERRAQAAAARYAERRAILGIK